MSADRPKDISLTSSNREVPWHWSDLSPYTQTDAQNIYSSEGDLNFRNSGNKSNLVKRAIQESYGVKYGGKDGSRIEDYQDKMDAMTCDQEDQLDTEALLGLALTSLEELKLNEAERQFLKAVARLQQSDSVRPLVEGYLGLAEVCTRKSRGFRQSPLEWLWLCVHAASLLAHVVDLCTHEMGSLEDNQALDWFTQQAKFAESRSQSLIDVMGRTLSNWQKEDWRQVDPNHLANLIQCRTPLTPRSSFLMSSTMSANVGPRPYQAGYMNHAFSIESLHEPPMSTKGGHSGGSGVSANWFKRILHYCHLRLSNTNVKEIISEISTLKEEEIGASPVDPKLEVISKISEETDMEMAKELCGKNKENVLPNLVNGEEELEVFSEETYDTYDIAEINEKSRTDSNVKEYSLMYELASSDVDTTGWEFFLEKRKDCVVQSVLEMKSNADHADYDPVKSKGEINGHELEVSGQCKLLTSSEGAISPEIVEKVQRFSPLDDSSLKLTIAKTYQVVVQKLMQDEQYLPAENLCEEILEIVEEIQNDTVRMLRFQGLMFQTTGLLCFRQGNRHNGMRNLEKGLKIYKDLQDKEAQRRVALVLIDLGNAYANDLHDDALYDRVIAAMCEFFEREASDEENLTGSTTPDRSSIPEPIEDLEQKKRISEAVKCYSEALAVLEGQEQCQLQTLAMAMRKLGDCQFVQKEYTEALDWYERALKLHRTPGFNGKDSMLENAHLLSMLGVSTFMLHVYPRASHVFELALHMVKYAHGLTLNTFLHCLVLSLLGISYYKMKSYHKCVSMCSRAFETFWNLYDEKVVELPQHKFWLVCQNLYILGNTYNVLNMHQKAIKFLEIGRVFMRESVVGEKRQHMRILQILGDCFFAQYDYKTALTYYNEALDIGDKVTGNNLSTSGSINQVSQVQSSSAESDALERMMTGSDVMTMSTSNEDLDMALHNQLLSRSADAHISMKQYGFAVTYLEQARDIQDVLEDDIKGDLVSTLHQLGQMHSMAGDVDKAIESYKESLEVFRELHDGELAPEMCVTLGNLATMCYVKACVCEDIDSELEMILSAEQFFQAALKEELHTSVCVKYANFLYSQANYEDAVMYLEDALKVKNEEREDGGMGYMDDTLFIPRPYSSDIVYGGLERVTLPEPLQEEVDAQEEAIMPTRALAHYILVLSHKMLGRLRHAEVALMELMGEVYARDIPFLHSVLGYAFMELGLFLEAAQEFGMAWWLDREYNLALDNYSLCLSVHAHNILERAFATIFMHCGIWNDDQKIDQQVANLLGYYT